MKKSIEKNYIYNLVYQIIAIIVPIITTPYLSRILGAENIGIYGYTLSISAYFILFGSLGIALYGKREIAYAQSDSKTYTKIFWELFVLRALTMVISLIIFYFLLIRGNNDYVVYYKILFFELIGEMLDISWFFQGLEEFKKTVLRNLIVKLLSVICIFIFVKTKDDLYIYFIIYVLSILVGNLSLWIYLPKYLNKIKIKTINITKHVKDTIIFFIPQMAIQVYTVLDRTMIGYLVYDKSEVGYYTQGEKIIKLLLAIITAMGTVMLPRIAFEYSRGNNEKIREHIYKSFNLVYLLAFPLIFGLISASKSFVPLFFGEGYSKVIPVMNLLTPIILLIGMSNVIGVQYLLPTKRQKEYTISVTIGVIVNFILNYILIHMYQSIGASIATVLSELVIVVIQYQYVKDQISFNELTELSWKYLFSGIVMFFVCYIVRILLRINVIGDSITNFANNIELNKEYFYNITTILIQTMFGIITYFGMLIVLKDDYVFKFFGKIKNILFKKKVEEE